MKYRISITYVIGKRFYRFFYRSDEPLKLIYMNVCVSGSYSNMFV